MKAKVILFKESGRHYTEEEWSIPENAHAPGDMLRSEDFRRIGNGAVLVEAQEPWGYPHLFPSVCECENCYGRADFVASMEATEIEPQEPVPEWIGTMWQYVLTGDHVRIGQEEADIKASSVIMWHAHEDGWEWNEQAGRNEMKVSRWDHKDVTITRASHPTEKLKFPPGAPVEILMNRERQAQHLLQTAFDAKPVQK